MTISTELLRYRPETGLFEATLDELGLVEPPTRFLLVNTKTGASQPMTRHIIIYEEDRQSGWRYNGGEYVALISAPKEEVK